MVLIVEDDVLVAFNLEFAVIDAGYVSALAPSATEARDLVAFSDPAVAVVDMRLRDGMTGPDLVRDLSSRGVPVIAVSGESSVDIEELPVFARVNKPAPLEQVLDHIRSAIGCDKAG